MLPPATANLYSTTSWSWSLLQVLCDGRPAGRGGGVGGDNPKCIAGERKGGEGGRGGGGGGVGGGGGLGGRGVGVGGGGGCRGGRGGGGDIGGCDGEIPGISRRRNGRSGGVDIFSRVAVTRRLGGGVVIIIGRWSVGIGGRWSVGFGVGAARRGLDHGDDSVGLR